MDISSIKKKATTNNNGKVNPLVLNCKRIFTVLQVDS